MVEEEAVEMPQQVVGEAPEEDEGDQVLLPPSPAASPTVAA